MADRADDPPGRARDVVSAGGGAGAKVQLLASGPQDAYLTSPAGERLFAWPMPRRHTPFANEAIECPFPSGFRPGRTNVLDLPRKGDVLGAATLEVRLPALGAGAAWKPGVGLLLVRRARLVVDDAVVHDSERLWADVRHKLFGAAGKRAGLAEMLGGSTAPLDASVPQLVYAPLHLFNRSPAPAASLLRMYRSAVRVSVEAEGLDGLLATRGSASAGALAAAAEGPWDVRLLADQAYLDRDERRDHVVNDDDAGTGGGLLYHAVQDSEATNFREFDDGLASTAVATVDLLEVSAPLTFVAVVAYRFGDAPFTYLAAADTYSLLFDGVDRVDPLPFRYFSLWQRYRHFPTCAPDNVAVYSFALDATRLSGHANLSKIQAFLKVRFAADAPARTTVKAFCHTINWLDCAGGQARPRFSA